MVVHDGKDGTNGISIAGPSGPTGSNGLQGSPGVNGQDGANITPTQIAQAISDYFTLNPVQAVKGDTGDRGEAAKTLVLCNLPGGVIGFSYVGETLCQLPENL